MPEPQTESLTDLLKRSVRRWRALALSALAALMLALAGWATTAAVQMRQLDQAMREAKLAEEERKEAQQRAERLLYFSQIHLAARAWAEGEKP